MTYLFRCGRSPSSSLGLVGSLAFTVAALAGEPPGAWRLPAAHDVRWSGALGQAYTQSIARLSLPPYDSAAYLRSDFSFETNRIFVNYSGDVSGRFIQIASLVSPPGRMQPPALAGVLRDLARYQRADGHFGRDVDWNQPLEPESPNAVLLPIFWGNSRLLVGLIEAWRAFGREDCLAAARRLGDFYIATAGRFLDPAREAEYRMTGSYAAGYPTDYFPGIEGLALLYQATRDARYLRQAERMADFFERFDTLPTDHSHGNLITHYGLLLLYEITGKREYLDRPLAQWRRAVEGGYVWPMGGVGEKFRVSYDRDEGCSEADWLRLNLRLWELTGEPRFPAMAERLLWNHYAMNRAPNGGYGHHEFVCDGAGPLGLKPGFTEAVWCCTFHGLLGLHEFKRHILASSQAGVFVHFPVSASSTLQVGRGRRAVEVTATENTPGTVSCRVRLGAPEGAQAGTKLFFRRPAWAAEVRVTDGEGRSARVLERNGYLITSAKVARDLNFTLTGALRVEDRRLRRVRLDSAKPARLDGVTLWLGPHLLLANTDERRIALQGRVLRNGELVAAFPDALSPTAQPRPGADVRRDAPAAFIFDLMTTPDPTRKAGQ
jgi:DUF1680 family protein